MPPIFPRFRFLPFALFIATFFLTVKIGIVWQNIDSMIAGSISVTNAVAQSTAGPNKTAKNEAAVADPMKQTGLANAEDIPRFSSSEVEILQHLAERRQALEAREGELAKRDALLKVAETRIDQKVQELKTLQTTLERLIKTYDEQQEAKMSSLVKIYENMKPKDAARIFEELDIDTLLPVAERMKERKLAPIMAEMNPAKAKNVTVELARLRELTPTKGQPSYTGRG